VDRSRQGELKGGALPVPVRSIAHVEFNYDDDGEWNGSTFFKHAGFGIGKFISRDKQATLWTRVQCRTGVSIVEHKSPTESVLERLVNEADPTAMRCVPIFGLLFVPLGVRNPLITTCCQKPLD
jgi:hypothetical protein